MSTAPVLPFVSVDEYLHTEYEPACEYVDGVLVPKAGEGDAHSHLQELLIIALAALEREFNLVVRPERHIRISPTRFRIPDIAVFTSHDRSRAANSPPLFTIEIVSPDETYVELLAKVDDHLAMGVRTVIVPDPHRRTLMIARQDEPLHKLASPLLVRIEVPDRRSFHLDFDDLFSKLDL